MYWTRLYMCVYLALPCSSDLGLRNNAITPDFGTWMNQTVGGLEASAHEGRRLEEKDGALASKRLCARALKNMRDEEYKMSIPDSDIDRYVKCMECTPTR